VECRAEDPQDGDYGANRAKEDIDAKDLPPLRMASPERNDAWEVQDSDQDKGDEKIAIQELPPNVWALSCTRKR